MKEENMKPVHEEVDAEELHGQVAALLQEIDAFGHELERKEEMLSDASKLLAQEQSKRLLEVEELRGQLAVVSQELDATADQLTRTERALNDASEQLVAADLERDTVRKQNATLSEALDICERQILNLKRKNAEDNHRYQKMIQSLLRVRAKSYLVPGIIAAVCGLLAALVNLAVKHYLVAAILGVPLVSICLLICVFCLGMIVERFISWHIRKPEGKKRHEVHSTR